MSEIMTKNMSRNIFYGGSLFFIIIFIGLSIHSHYYIANVSTDKESLNASVVAGKRIWEDKACINCHTILGEGAYYAPEVGNVMTRWGVLEDPEDAYITLKNWMESMPTEIEGRRQMPRF